MALPHASTLFAICACTLPSLASRKPSKRGSIGPHFEDCQRACVPVARFSHLNPVTKRASSASAPQLFPQAESIEQLRTRAKRCKACDLWRNATQTVFGEGTEHPKILVVGEQPGNQEDLQGRPFVGPAGKLLDSALEEAGIDREKTYITNAVKHFKWELRGKRRIHKKPSVSEIAACWPWLEAEIAALKPEVIVCLGATAAQALLGRDFRVTQQRGELMKSSLAPFITATLHPSSILRAPDEETRRTEMERFIDDLKNLSLFTR
jgi:uracil-DNA glycosylase family protein